MSDYGLPVKFALDLSDQPQPHWASGQTYSRAKSFSKNVELYPGSANVYDSLGEGLEAAGKLDSATQNFQKAIEMATKNNDGALPEFKRHLKRVTAAIKAAASKNANSQ